MRTFLVSLLVTVLSGVIVLGMSMANAYAATGCIINVAGIKICGELLGQPLPEVVEVTVTAPPIRLPGPTQTVTVRPPAATRTVPGPTVTVRPEPQPARTVTVQPEPTSAPRPTVTETVTVRPSPQPNTGQSDDEPGTVGPTPGASPPPQGIDIDPFDWKIVDDKLTIGVVATLALLGITLLAMYTGYILGYKDKERKETAFLRAILERSKISRRQHR